MYQWPTHTLSAPPVRADEACLAIDLFCSSWRDLTLQIPRLLHPFTAIPANRRRESS